MNTALLLLALVALAACFPNPIDAIRDRKAKKLFDEWKKTHNKVYPHDTEHSLRFAIFKANLNYIESHNKDETQTFKLAMNQFGDLTGKEYATQMNGFDYDQWVNKTPNPNVEIYENLEEPEASNVDWRDAGVVTPVKNQGQCGSCWSFSTTGSLEGAWALKHGKNALTSLSEQNLMDCSRNYGNNGCNGGLMDNAFRYIMANKGDDTESSYPYTARDGYTCKFKESDVGSTMVKYTDVSRGSEKSLTNAAAKQPVSVAIDASHQSFQFYKSGVYNERSCSSSRLDHGVLVIGYGTENGKDYYLVKNSWGATWGLAGYIKMSRNANNQCGIATSASFPTV